jgi:tetratricopeptide (TPR) repeat protein
MLARIVITALVAFRLSVVQDDPTDRQPQRLYGQAESAYNIGKSLETKDPKKALAKYKEALGYLSANIALASGSLLGQMAAEPQSNGVNVTPDNAPTGFPRMRDEYATAAALAGSIAVDEARLHRLYGDDPAESLTFARDAALAILLTRSITNPAPRSGCVGTLPRDPAYIEKSPDDWRQAPLPLHEAAAYFNMGIVQLFQGEESKAKNCFQQVLRIDPTNEIARSYKAAFADAPDDEKDRQKLGASVVAALLAEYPAVSTITQAVLNYFIDRMPDPFRQ